MSRTCIYYFFSWNIFMNIKAHVKKKSWSVSPGNHHYFLIFLRFMGILNFLVFILWHWASRLATSCLRNSFHQYSRNPVRKDFTINYVCVFYSQLYDVALGDQRGPCVPWAIIIGRCGQPGVGVGNKICTLWGHSECL